MEFQCGLLEMLQKFARVRRFGGGGHGIIREQVVEKIQVIVDEFEGLDVKS